MCQGTQRCSTKVVPRLFLKMVTKPMYKFAKIVKWEYLLMYNFKDTYKFHNESSHSNIRIDFTKKSIPNETNKKNSSNPKKKMKTIKNHSIHRNRKIQPGEMQSALMGVARERSRKPAKSFTQNENKTSPKTRMTTIGSSIRTANRRRPIRGSGRQKNPRGPHFAARSDATVNCRRFINSRIMRTRCAQ